MRTTFRTKDREYTLSALTLDDWQSLRKYVQYRDYFQMKIDVATIPELSELLPNLLRECSKREVDMTKIDVLINAGAFDVVLELVYLSLVHYHHDIERDEIRQFVNMQNTQEVLALIMDLSSVANDNKSGKVKNPRRAKAKPKT